MTSKAHIFYTSLPDEMRKEEKLDWLKTHRFNSIPFEKITPDKNNNWINLAENDWDQLIPIATKDVKFNRSNEAVFSLYSLGTVSNRDDWVYDFDKKVLHEKIQYFVRLYNTFLDENIDQAETEPVEISSIKFTRDLKKRLLRKVKLVVDYAEFRECQYRVFTVKQLYFAPDLNEMRYQTPVIFPYSGSENVLLALNQGSRPFNVLSSKTLVDLHFNGDSQCFPFFRYDSSGTRHDNITDWGLQQFTGHYEDESITKEDIFHYTYAVLHDPAYRKKYELNLKREFPRLPFYGDFRRWAAWGRRLMELHINYETVEPYDLKENTYEVKAEAKRQVKIFKDEVEEPGVLYQHIPKIKVKLKADKTAGIIELDELTFLSGVPAAAWEYKLGNRSALEWILDQYKEKKPSDPKIVEKFNTYRFADYKTHVIDLLKRVCTVSVETMRIVGEMGREG